LTNVEYVRLNGLIKNNNLDYIIPSKNVDVVVENNTLKLTTDLTTYNGFIDVYYTKKGE